MTAIEVRDASKVFASRSGLFARPRLLRAVDGVSFTVPEGECLGIVGESGCGKSTLARLILGLIPLSAGKIHIDGRPLASVERRERARLIQPVFQDPFSSLNPRRRVRDAVALPLAVQGVSREERYARADAMLRRVGLSAEAGERFPAQLSGGQRQRVAIARALVTNPRILICDEPTSALDVSVQAQILNLLQELRASLKLTVILISHNLAVVEHLCDAVAVMYLGRIVEFAPVETLFRAPRHPYTRILLDSVLTPEPGLGLPDVGLGESYPDPANIPAGCRFHPRCPLADADCARLTPEPRKLGDRLVECLLAAE